MRGPSGPHQYCLTLQHVLISQVTRELTLSFLSKNQLANYDPVTSAFGFAMVIDDTGCEGVGGGRATFEFEEKQFQGSYLQKSTIGKHTLMTLSAVSIYQGFLSLCVGKVDQSLFKPCCYLSGYSWH